MPTIVTVICAAGLGSALVAVAASTGITAERSARDAPIVPVAALMHGPTARSSPPTVQSVFEAQLDVLLSAIDTLAARVRQGRTAGAQKAFRQARTAYKSVEGLIAYYAPSAAMVLEGPLEAEGEDNLARPFNTPGAFPAIETAIFPTLTTTGRGTVLNQIHAMHEQVAVLRSMTGTLRLDEAAVFDAARAEIARVSTLDVAGFDSDREDDALLDAAAALDGVRATLIAPEGPKTDIAAVSWRAADSTLREAAGYLRRNASFERMDRLVFITRYSVPASHAVAALRSTRSIPSPVTKAPPLWRNEAASVYDSGAFDPTAYGGRFRFSADARVRIIALGARLFSDQRLSGSGTRACATCHVPSRAFTDGLPKRMSLVIASSLPPGGPPPRHTPPLINVALQPALFDDERARNLETQVAAVLANPDEMGSSLDTAVQRVAADSTYRRDFAAAFGGPPDQAVTPLALRVAIATYERSLTGLNSRFDRAVRGDTMAMTAAEQRGFTVFMGKGRCGSCHFAPLFNGTQPPSYLSTDPEIIGVPEKPVLKNARLDPDSGRGAIDHVDSHLFAFKVPTVRNSAQTAPYMHNGAYPTLEDVIAFYNAGGGSGIGIKLPYQTLFDGSLKLTPGEQADLVDFLRSLTDGVSPAPPGSTVLR